MSRKIITGAASGWRRSSTVNPTPHNPEDVAAPAEYESEAPAPALTPDEQPQTVAMSPQQIAAAEAEKTALLSALKLPAPAAGPEARDGREQRHAPTPAEVETMFQPEPVTAASDSDPVVEALADQARLLQAVEDAKAALEAGNIRVAQAREQVASDAYQIARREASTRLKPLAAKVVAQRKALQEIHARYGPDLKDFGRSLASGDNAIRRAKIQSLYSSAPLLANKIAVAFKAAEHAIHLLDRANRSNSAETLPFALSVAVAACDSALAHSVDALREECVALGAAINAWRNPGQTIRIRLTNDSEPWRPSGGQGSSASGVEV